VELYSQYKIDGGYSSIPFSDILAWGEGKDGALSTSKSKLTPLLMSKATCKENGEFAQLVQGARRGVKAGFLVMGDIHRLFVAPKGCRMTTRYTLCEGSGRRVGSR